MGDNKESDVCRHFSTSIRQLIWHLVFLCWGKGRSSVYHSDPIANCRVNGSLFVIPTFFPVQLDSDSVPVFPFDASELLSRNIPHYTQ